METKLGTSDVLLCLYLRTHQWDKRESIYYKANSSSFLPSCSPHHPSVAAVAWAQQGGAKGVALGCCWPQGLPKACWPSHLAHADPPALAVLAHSALQPHSGNNCT